MKFINILIEKHVTAKLDGKCGRLRHNDVFKSSAKALSWAGSGTPKTFKHCKGKYRKLREMFLECFKHNSTSGSDRKECPHCDLWETLFSKRPKATAYTWGYDSGVEPQSIAPSSQAESISGTHGTADTEGDTTPKTGGGKLPPKYRSGNFKSSKFIHMGIRKGDWSVQFWGLLIIFCLVWNITTELLKVLFCFSLYFSAWDVVPILFYIIISGSIFSFLKKAFWITFRWSGGGGWGWLILCSSVVPYWSQQIEARERTRVQAHLY